MHLLYQQFGELIEAERACSFEQDNFVVQGFKHFAADEIGYVVKEELCFQTFKSLLLSYKSGANADKLLYTTLLYQCCHVGIKLLFGFATLINVAQDKCALAAVLVGTAVHKVECDVERINIGVVRIVDERAAVLPFFHFKAHCDRFERCHTLRQHIGQNAKVQCNDSAGDAVAHTCLIDERQGKAAVRSVLPYIRDGRCRVALLYTVYKEGCGGVVFRPRKQFSIVMIR